MFRGGDVLLVQRGKGIYRGAWSLPGGALELGETAREAAKRELLEETGLLALDLTLSDVADAILKDPGGAVETHYMVAVYASNRFSGTVAAGSDAPDARLVQCGGHREPQADARPGGGIKRPDRPWRRADDDVGPVA